MSGNPAGDIANVVRDARVSIALAAGVIANFLFSITTLAHPFAVGVLFVLVVALHAVASTSGSAELARQSARAALTAPTYPTTIDNSRTIGNGYALYIGAWLAWWIITQLVFDAGTAYDSALVSHIGVAPLVAALAVQHGLTKTGGALHGYTLAALRALTFVAFFIPSVAWAPQHGSAATTSVRVVLYFSALALFEYVAPAQTRAYLDAAPGGDAACLVDELDAAELAQVSDERVRCAQALMYAENAAAREQARQVRHVTSAAWVLVLPLVPLLVLYVPSVATFIYAHRRQATRAPPKSAARRSMQAPAAQEELPPVPSAPTSPPPPTAARESAASLAHQSWRPPRRVRQSAGPMWRAH